MLKLRSNPAPATAPDRKFTTTRAILVDRLMKETQSIVPVAHHKHFLDFLHASVDAALKASTRTHTSPATSVDMNGLRAGAREAATRLAVAAAAGDTAASGSSAPGSGAATWRGVAAAAGDTAASAGAAAARPRASGRPTVDVPDSAAAAEAEPAGARAPARAGVELEARSRTPAVAPAAPGAISSRVDTAVLASPLRASDSLMRRTDAFDPSSPAAKAVAALRKRMGDDVPEPQVFRRKEEQVQVKRNLLAQIAERQLHRQRERAMDTVYAAATDEIVARAADVEAGQRQRTIERARDNAEQARRFIASHKAHQEAARAAQLREEEALLKHLRDELAREERQLAEARERERRGIVESMLENQRLRALREEARAKAVEDELREAQIAAERVAAAEQAHKEMYRNIAERQNKLARQLEAATEAVRKKREEWERRSEEAGVARDRADAEAEARRQQARKKAMDETVSVLRSMLDEKAARRAAQRQEDKSLLEQSQRVLAELAADRTNLRVTKRDVAKRYGEELRSHIHERRNGAGGVPTDAKAAFDGSTFTGTSIKLNNTSSDYDTEAMFRRELHALSTVPGSRGNNSESVAPLLGFGAPFASSLEAQALSITGSSAALLPSSRGAATGRL